LLTVVMVSPYAALAWLAWTEVPATPAGWDAKAQSTFWSAVLLCALACLLALVLALSTLVLLWLTAPGGSRLALLVALLLLFALSPVIQLTGWRALGVATAASPLAVSAVVLSWKYFPLIVGLTLASLRLQDGHALDAVRMVSDRLIVLARVLLPPVTTALAAGAVAVAALVFLEAEVPPLLGLDVYASDYLGRLALDPSAAGALQAGVPFLIVGLALIALFAARVRAVARAPWSGGALAAIDAFRPAAPRARVAALLAALMFLTPMLALVPSALGDGLAQAGSADARALGTSCLLGAVCAAIAGALSYALASCLIDAHPGFRLPLLAFVGLCLLVPGTLTGLSVAQLAGSPVLAPLLQGDVPLIVAHTLRLLPAGTLLMTALRWAEPAALREELRLTGAPWLAEQRFLALPMHWPGIVAVCALLFVLALSELGSTVLVVAPGTETAILRLYNLMHYGAGPAVALLALAQTGLTAVVIIATFLLARTYWHAARRAT
jgi:iron(III) transport system permease protein